MDNNPIISSRQFDEDAKRRRRIDHPGYGRHGWGRSGGPVYGVAGGYAGFALVGDSYPLSTASANEPDGSIAEDGPQANFGGDSYGSS